MIPEVNENYLWWYHHRPAEAMTLFGEMDWKDYEFGADVYIEEGEVYLAVRKGEIQVSTGYSFVIDKSGSWKISYDNIGYGPDMVKQINDWARRTLGSGNIVAEANTIKRGTIASFESGKWHNIKLLCKGNRIDVYVDSIRVCTVIDKRRTNGQPCLGGSYDLNQFDNISVKSY